MRLLYRLTGMSTVQTGILLTIASMFCLTSMDATVKFLSSDYSVMQLVWVRYVGQTVLVVGLFWRRLPQITSTRHPWLQSLRSLCLFGGTICFFIGFINVDLVSATTILQTSPLFVALLAVFVLSERIGWVRLLGIGFGLVGTLIIIRPGTEVFSPYSIITLGAALCYASYSVLTRLLSRDESVWNSLLFTSLAGAIISTLFAPLFWKTPAVTDIPFFVLASVCGACGHLFLIMAHFRVDATVLAPFTYSSLIFATLYGAIIFGDFPNLMTIMGAMIVVGSGLLVWYRESQGKAEQ